MKLNQLIQGLEILKTSGDSNISISGLAYDSRKVKPGDIFVTWQGTHNDGLVFVDEALNRGAKVLCVEEEGAHSGKVPYILVKNARHFLADAANLFYQNPSQQLKMIGVTGTNGKTTVGFLIEAILRDQGLRPGLLGTIHYKIGDRLIPSERTTPESLDIQKFLREMIERGCQSCVMEVSSHALDQDRVRGVDFDGAVFTNLTQDHLDYHHDLENYFHAKSLLFSRLTSHSFAVVNIDDAFGVRLQNQTPAQWVSYGFSSKAMVRAQNVNLSAKGSDFEIIFPQGKLKIHSKLIGQFNILNLLAAFSVGWAMKLDIEKIKHSLENFHSVPGRMEFVKIEVPFHVVVDYAHTEDALKNVLMTLRPIVKGRLLTLFGCGGDRDKGKRPKMGKVVGQYSDFAIVTSDNPRSEDPKDIAEEIEKGLKETKISFQTILDRKAAIEFALGWARPGDLILIAGKGHEKFQEIGLSRFPFDDVGIVKELSLRQIA